MASRTLLSLSLVSFENILGQKGSRDLTSSSEQDSSCSSSENSWRALCFVTASFLLIFFMACRMFGGMASSAAPADESKASPRTGPSAPPPVDTPPELVDGGEKVEPLDRNSAALELEKDNDKSLN